MITVIARLTAQAGKEDDVRAALTEMVTAVSEHEPGVPTYSLHVSGDDPAVFMFYEQYDGADAQQAHRETDHMRALGGKLQGLLAGRMEISRYTQIAGVER